MRLTLLQIVQDVLAAIDSEHVTSVGETEESGMVINIANRSYEEMMSMHKWKHLKTLINLDTTTALNELTVPAGTVSLDPDNVYYDDQPVFYRTPEEFLYLTIGRVDTDADVDVINNFKIHNERNPQWYTSVDDETLVFDSHPTGGLLGADSLAFTWKVPTSRLTANSEIFDLPAQAFPALVSLCISKALNELKGDTEGATKEYSIFRKLVGSLSRNARLVDNPSDKRQWIVPRRTVPRTDSLLRRLVE